jgi:hypothetical protein
MVVSGLFAGSASADDFPSTPPVHAAPLPPAWVWEFGGRYWYSSGKNWYNYYGDTTASLLVSRLTYQGMTGQSGEAFFRVDSVSGMLERVFVKGYAGGGAITKGTLIDEDFPPLTVPYSSTSSDILGHLSYASVDAGFTFLDNTRRNYSSNSEPWARVRLGAFAGYHYWHELANANGCSQTGGNTAICGMPVPTSITLATEQDTWNSLRLGMVGDILFTPRLKLTAEVAYARTWQKALDTHYFTFGPDPASGSGNGFQTEAVLSYRVTRAFDLGVGGRWWHFQTNAIDSFGQLLQYSTDRYGAFMQASLKLED